WRCQARVWPGVTFARCGAASLRRRRGRRARWRPPASGPAGRSNALSLPLRGYHEGDFGEVRRRVQEVAGTSHDHLAFARPGHGQESDLGLVVDIAQRLQFRIGERTHPPEEPRIDLVWRETVKLRLQR